MLNLDTKIRFMKGIGPKRSLLFAKLGVKTLKDMLTFFPFQYQDRSKIMPIKDAYTSLQGCIFGKVGKLHERRLSQELYVLGVEIFDDASVICARFFRKRNRYSNADIFSSLRKVFKPGTFVYIYGYIKVVRDGKFINAEDYELVESESNSPLSFNKIIPVYPATEGLHQRFIREAVRNVLKFAELYPDISYLFAEAADIPKLNSSSAICKIHYPDTLDDAEFARRSFALQEFFILQVALSLSRNSVKKSPKLQKYEIRKTLLATFRNNLGFEFTKGQKKATNEIFSDMQDTYPMNRILMGDVGSGKTVVALSAVLLAVENGYQAMVIAPTELLAEQHYLTITNMLSGLNVKTALATSSTLKRKKGKENILSGLENGDIKIAIGTHSLIENRVRFKNLSLVAVDEQHRFGVVQKAVVLNKAQSPDILMMTATPIPRALAMTVYGEMDITTITDLPQGRTPAKTYSSDENFAYANAIEELKKGNQVYIVYPLIEESEKVALKSAVLESEKLSQTWFKDFKVGLLHGKMKPSKKNETMQKFKNKGFDVLIATTIIEVGIDVPDATVMIVQHAERFGLSVLHQLRGRIGRSTKQSYVYLIETLKSKNSSKRLSIMTSTNSGFRIAEEDLKMRGPGELMGTAQHGFPQFKAGDLIKDVDIIEFAKGCAAKAIEEDPTLSKGKNVTLKKLISENFSDKIKFINVG